MAYGTSLPLHQTEFETWPWGKKKPKINKSAKRKAKRQCKFRSKNPGCAQKRR